MAYGAYKVGSKDIIKRKSKQKESQNNNGILGAAGYLVGSALAGVGSIAEGVIDGTLAPLADLTGNHDYAEYVFKKNVVGDWHADITEEYNPDGVMGFFGDVAHGLGQSAWMFIPYAGKPLYMMGIMSQGISSAVAETGDVGIKEAAYGLTSGAVEGGLELAFSGASKGAKTVMSSIGKKSGKQAIKTAFGTAARKGVVKQVLSDAASEFMEEAASEVIDTGLQRFYKINPDKELNWGDVLYSGAVGAVSGGVSGGTVSVTQASVNRARGARIIKNGNAQTVVNTANYVADRLAASGTDFKNAPEWVKTLRGEVDAYNKLAAKGQQNSASAQTILGEMQASLFFAETQAKNAEIQTAIQNLDENKRAALAEYINQTIPNEKRPRVYTAEDVAKNTDEIATQLAIMQFAGRYFNYDAAIADMAQESGIESVIEKEQGKATGVQSEAPTAQAAPVDAAFKKAAAEGVQSAESGVQSEAPVDAAVEVGEVKHDLADDVADIESSATEIDDDIDRIREDVKKAVSGIKVDGKLYELSDKQIGNIANGVQKYIRQGMSESDAIAEAVRTRLVDIKSMGEESGVKHELGKATLTKVRGAVINAYRSGMQSRTVEDAAKTAQEARKTSEGTEAQRSAENVTEGKESGKVVEKSSERKEKSSESKKTETKEPKVSEAKESLTDKQRAERTKKQAERWIEWEKKTAPTAQELNKARKYVKGFDNLNNTRRLAIIRMIRSADGVDEQTVRGIANLMAVIPESNLEVRFAKGIGNKGLITKIGNKSVIVLDSSVERKTTIKGTIAHELTHYLENKAGYEQLAKYVRDHAKPEAIEKHKNRYINGWAKIGHDYTEAELDSEITASLVADALNNERFLKRYADRDKKLIQKAFEWLKGLVGRAKKTEGNEEISEVAEKMMYTIDVLLQMPTIAETEIIAGEIKFDLDEKLGEQLQDWLDNAGKKGKKYNGSYFDLGTTPDVFVKHGAKKVNMIMYEDVVAKVTGMKGDISHTISIEEIAKLPSQLNDPILLFKGSVSGSFVALTELIDKYGNDVVVAVHINRTGEDRSKITKIASLYSKTNDYGKNKIESYVKKQIDQGNLIDASVKKAPMWFTTRGLQLPKAVQTIIDANNSIPQKSDLSTPFEKKYDLADEDADGNAEEKVKKKAKTKAEVIAENKELRAENKELKANQRATQNKMRGMLEKLAREEAEYQKRANAEVFAKEDVALAVSSIESWTREEALSLTTGFDLKGMNKARREDMISQIYIALHEQSARGQSGPGSVAVKAFATEIASEYIDSAQIVGEDGKSYHFADIYDEASVNGFKQELADLLYGEFSNMGKATAYGELVNNIRAQKERFRQERLNEAMLSKDAKNVAYQALKIRDIAATQKREPATDGIQRITKMLGAVVDPKGNIRISMIDKAMAEASAFLEGESMKSLSESDQVPKEAKINNQDLSANISDTIKFKVDEFVRLRKGHEGKALNAEEMRLASEILQGMRMTIERYNKEFVNGHWVDVETISAESAEDLLSFVAKDREYKTKVGEFLGKKIGKNVDQIYFYYILSPETVIEALEGYKQGGLLKSLYHSVRVAKQKAEHRAVQMKKPFAEFLDKKDNRWESDGEHGGRRGWKYSYRDKLNVRMINVNGTNITLGEAIYLYMLTKREHAWAGLQNEGFITYDENNKQRERIKLEDIPRARDLIYNQLDKTDLEFLQMAEEFFNKTATKVKEDADMEIFGFTNTQDSYYVPIIRDRYSRMGGVTDARQSIGSIITVYNKSFNQNLVENAKALEGKNVMSIINDHADGLADYAELYLPLKAFDRVYNKVVPTSEGNRSLREILNTKVWDGTEGYLKKLFSDIQGQGREQDKVIDKIVGRMRSAWVNSVLGANLKVVATQTTSLGAATQVIEPKYIMPATSVIPQFKGEKISALRERAYKYSDIIEARSFDMGALKAQGNIDKVNIIGEKSGFLIGAMDEQICLTIFHAAELKVQDTKGYAIGTEENARLAAKIADEAIYTTQAMTAASERSALQRSTSEIAKLFSMFTSDSVKNLSHLYGNTMKYIAHSQRVKAGDTSYQAMLEQDKREIGRSMRTMAITGIMLGLITQGFKYLYAKEEEEPEDKAKDFALDIASSTLNVFPIWSDVVDKFVFNYDMSMNVLDVANDGIESLSKGFKTMGKSMSGEYVSTGEAAGVTLDIIKSGASMFGIPVAPVERTITGLLRRFAPSTVYGYDAMFSNPSYTADLKKAVESGDEALAEHVLSELYKSEVNGTYTSAELEEVVRLYSLTDEEGKHYSVLPQKIGKEINGVKLSAAQRKQFTKIYAQASGEVNKLIRSNYYSALNDEQKAKAIRNLYAMYYGRAATEVVGKEMTSAVAYSYLTSNYAALFASQAYKGGLEEQKDASGKKITVGEQFVEYAKNLELSESDYVVITYANGVRNKANKAALLQYINSLSLSPEIKAQIAERLGFEYRDGAVVEKTE